MEQLRLFDIPYLQQRDYKLEDALVTKVNGSWKKVSTDEFIQTSEKLAHGLLALGINKGDTIACISTNNRHEWNFLDMAVQMSGGVLVPMYPTISDNDYRFIFNDAGVKYVFVSDDGLFKRVKEVMKDVPSIKNIYTFNNVSGAPSWREVLERGDKNPAPDKLTEVKKSILPTDLATLIYTSGTTGTPKGVMLSHNNIVSNVVASHPLIPVGKGEKALSFLPLCHIYERMLNYLYQYSGISIYYAESIDTIGDNLKEVKPEIFVAVPRVLEKIYDKIMATGSKLEGLKKVLFFWSIRLGMAYEHYHANGWWYDFQLSIARKLVFSKWQEAVGGNLKVVVSGGAAFQPRLARIFWAAGIPVLEGYGLTETSPVIAVNNLGPNNLCFGTVGPILPGVEVKFAEDGEILAKGPNIMMGYYKRPDATAETITDGGWFHTGDIGVMVDNKFLKITDRKKALLKTSGGKYIAPQPIENKMKESRYIEQIMVVGDGQKFTGALIVPKFPQLHEWCKTSNIPFTSKEEIIQNKSVLELYRKEIDKYNLNFGHIEQVKRFELLPNEWTVEGGEITPKLDIKRKVILDKYKALVDKIYHDSDSVKI
jgi:long-chain acyl-CoA synthetase